MCGRYSITASPGLLAERFEASVSPEVLAQSAPRYNAGPSQSLPVVLNEGERQISLLRWGLVPRWSKDASSGYKMINARSETVEEKPSFREAIKKRRCLVLADGFFEWKKTPEGKIPMRITLKSGDPFAFAGLWETWKDPEGALLRTFTILTTKPNELVSSIHDRMPVMLLPEQEKLWMDNAAGPETWRSVLLPYPQDLMRAYRVSTRVNSPGNNDPSIIAPMN